MFDFLVGAIVGFILGVILIAIVSASADDGPRGRWPGDKGQ